jgi:TonB family protein
MMKVIPILLLLAAGPAVLRAQAAEPAPDPADTLRAMEMSAVDERPSLADRAEVARTLEALYPTSLRDSGVSGTATVRLVVDARGRPLAPRLAEASGHAELDSAALRAVEGMRFVPARRGGEPQPVWVTLPVSFVATPPADAAAPDSGLYEMNEVEDLPRLLNRADVARTIARVYPPLLRDRGQTGDATITFIVDEEGRPGRIEVERASQPEFASAAREVAAAMRFQPARVDGRKVQVRVTLPISFELASRSRRDRDPTPPPMSQPRSGNRP